MHLRSAEKMPAHKKTGQGAIEGEADEYLLIHGPGPGMRKHSEEI
jgi:hypothetical protein